LSRGERNSKQYNLPLIPPSFPPSSAGVVSEAIGVSCRLENEED